MFSPGIKQAWLSSAILINLLATGLQSGYASSLLAGINAPDSTIKVSLETSTWIVSSFSVATVLGFLLNTLLIDRLGRRFTFGIELLPSVVAMLMIYYANDATLLIIGRAMGGLSSAGTYIVGAISIGEYCSPVYRSIFLNLKTLITYIGVLFVHLMGYYFHWRTVAILSIIPYVLAIFITCTWPESPYWLAMKGRFAESEETFYKLRGTTEDSVREIEELIKSQRNSRRKVHRTLLQRASGLIRKFTKKNFWKPMLIFFVSAVLLEACGRNIFAAYASQIIATVTDNDSYAMGYNLGLDAAMGIGALVSVCLVNIMKIRKLLFSTGLASCILLGVTCTYALLVEKEFISKGYSAITIVLLGIYLMLANMGCATIPLLLMGEIFPLEHRAVASSLAGCIISINATVLFTIMPFLLKSTGFHGTFTVLGFGVASCLLILYYICPETKNRSLQEIEEYFECGRFREPGEARANEGVKLRRNSKEELNIPKLEPSFD